METPARWALAQGGCDPDPRRVRTGCFGVVSHDRTDLGEMRNPRRKPPRSARDPIRLGGWQVRLIAVVSVALGAGCIHTASAIIPATIALGPNLEFLATKQTSFSGVIARGTTATDGAELEGGYGARFRSIRKGPLSLNSSRGPKSPLLISTRLEGGTWGADGKYFTSGTTIGLAVGDRSWTFGFSAGAEYGGFRVSDWLVPVKAHFLYVGPIQLNVEAYAGKRYGEFADATAKVKGLVNAFGGTASVGFSGLTRGGDTHRRGIGLGIFAERMDGVTVVGASLSWLGSAGRARATFLRDSVDQQNRDEEKRVEVARLEAINCEHVISRLVDTTGRPYNDWLSINTTVTNGVMPLSAEMIRICKAEAWSEALRTDVGGAGAQVNSIVSLQPLLQQVQAFRDGATAELEARAAEEERERAAQEARYAAAAAAAAAEERARNAQREAEREAERAAAEREAAKPYVETAEDRKRAADVAKDLDAAIALRKELITELHRYRSGMNGSLELSSKIQTLEYYITCLTDKPRRGEVQVCVRPPFLLVW